MKIEKWIDKNCKSLKNKRVVISGATGGIGREICFFLARLGADLTIACRNKDKANLLKDEIKTVYKNANIDIVELDLNDFKSVKNCILSLKKYKGIDIFINNAAIYNVQLKTLDSGFNNIFQVNFLYSYYLTKEIFGELEKKAGSMCVCVGSIAHNYSKIDENDIDFSSRKKASKIYGNSKRFLMFSLFELFKNSKINLAVVHPGITLTNMTSHYPKAINWLVKFSVKILFPNPKRAALNVLFALNQKMKYHEWVGPSVFDVWGRPKVTKLKTCNMAESKKIYTFAEKLYKNLKDKK